MGKKVYKFVRVADDKGYEYGIANLRKGALTARRTERFLEDDPNEMKFILIPDESSGVGDEDCAQAKEIFERGLRGHALKNYYICCFSFSNDFSDERKWGAYGRNCMILEYDLEAIKEAIWNYAGDKHIVVTFKDVHYGPPPNLTPFYLEVLTIEKECNEYSLNEEFDGDLADCIVKKLTKQGKEILLTLLSNKTDGRPFPDCSAPRDFSWEKELRIIATRTNHKGDFLQICEGLYPSTVYIDRARIGPVWMKIAEICRPKWIPVVDI